MGPGLPYRTIPAENQTVIAFGETLIDPFRDRNVLGRAPFSVACHLRAFLVAGDSGNDLEMLVGDTQAVVVSNHSVELGKLRGLDQGTENLDGGPP